MRVQFMCFNVFSCFLLLLTTTAGTEKAESTQNSRGLQLVDKPSVEVLATWNTDYGAALVRVRPNFVGPCPGDGEDDAAPFINYFFAVYQDVDYAFGNTQYGEYPCDFSRDVDTCYYKDLLYVCTGTYNSVTLYARSPSLPRNERVENPKIGREGTQCFPQDFTRIGRTRMIEVEIDCYADLPPLLCETDEDCPLDLGCLDSGEGYTSCSPAAQLGESCPRDGHDEDISAVEYLPCAGGLSCQYTQSCWLEQCPFSGKANVCVPYGADCTSIDDPSCNSDSEYCDLEFQKCLPYKKDKDCCRSDDECSPGYFCVGYGIYYGSDLITCRKPCNEDTDCNDVAELFNYRKCRCLVDDENNNYCDCD